MAMAVNSYAAGFSAGKSPLAAPSLGIRINIKLGGATNEIAPEDVAVNFDDVKGCDEAKQELQEIVDFPQEPREFDEVLVGQGAKRVRELFAAAKAKAPCVIFIDEIDSVGSTRTSSAYHPYANQTVNQLLSEMDGFSPVTVSSSWCYEPLLRPGQGSTTTRAL
ncbi:ATPdependent zinc metalloprotease YME1 -like protein [Caligus rogercresseyi]|uniref:ATPdependent zinc metalloprotease YME1 -like protein n=1 Tax=Caligus rogercresseyi TaxID=217165 RepID=A0A7T8KKN6_CALRO|nr:ATPdependent zinc metalloprotease YME1 -like protein [Caligus rogercresseyi]